MTRIRPELRVALEAIYAGARLETLPGDASTRRFHRLSLASGGTCVVMDYGKAFDGETDDIRLTRIFERAALPVARVLDVLPEAGALVLEDLGDTTFEVALGRAESGRGPNRLDLYRAALALAAAVATRGTETLRRSDRSVAPSIDEDRLLFEMRYFLEHFVGGFLALPAAQDELREPLFDLARIVATHPRVLCHRDFHSRNLMVLPNHSLAMVDIQDARWGPDSYDVASLVRDAYVEISESDVAEFVEIYRLQLDGPPEPEAFAQRFRLVAAQRMIKALGTFGYQVTRLERDRYREAIPRTVGRLARVLGADPQTDALATFFQRIERSAS
jgi:aminoglycoside/choline kinase family phosphotransferase